jgi:glutaconate CoA-transferase subunit A
LARVNPNIRFLDCPFTGEQLACVPAIRPDVSIIHAQKADRDGNVLVEGIVGVQKEAVLAACRAIATVEEIVDRRGTKSRLIIGEDPRDYLMVVG